ncbi:hypothetical protein LTR53_003490 [Teratosphaeriaceae sp. CCFEE 6253]|nr:hypothetical protein LTR53_003490 [Teratosphaeriaceae sp. CCFEE 6253]
MAPSKADRFTLSVKPVNFSLTAGTNIPAPLDSPPTSPAGSLARPPTPGGGPLTSHPATPVDVPGAFPPTLEPERGDAVFKKPSATSTTAAVRKDSFRTPLSPASAAMSNQASPPEPPQRRPSNVRKLLSLSSLRSSFNSSRTSLLLPRSSSDQHSQHSQQIHSQYNSLKRPSSPSIASTYASYQASVTTERPQLRSKKSGSWFRRKSGMFLRDAADDTGSLDAVDENQRPDTRDSKRLKESEPAPMLPEVGTLRGGRLGGGQIGWDENVFGGR